MSNENHNQLNNLLALLSPTDLNNPDVVQEEPCTYHRRGQRFKSSTAHHANSLTSIFLLLEIISSVLGPQEREDDLPPKTTGSGGIRTRFTK